MCVGVVVQEIVAYRVNHRCWNLRAAGTIEIRNWNLPMPPEERGKCLLITAWGGWHDGFDHKR
jgi:hypothetical protein